MRTMTFEEHLDRLESRVDELEEALHKIDQWSRAGHCVEGIGRIARAALNQQQGFFAQLTPEQQKAALEYDGPENQGGPEFLNQQKQD